jgi:hypothetical protein
MTEEEKLQALGWPQGIDQQTVEWLELKIASYLRRAEMPAWLIQRNLSYEDDAPKTWKGAVLLDWQFRAIHRACAGIGAELVWRLPPKEETP